MTEELLPLCPCGCGHRVEYKGKKYYKDHFRNPQPISTPKHSIIQDMPDNPSSDKIDSILKSKWEFDDQNTYQFNDQMEITNWDDDGWNDDDQEFKESSYRRTLLRNLKINR